MRCCCHGCCWCFSVVVAVVVAVVGAAVLVLVLGMVSGCVVGVGADVRVDVVVVVSLLGGGVFVLVGGLVDLVGVCFCGAAMVFMLLSVAFRWLCVCRGLVHFLLLWRDWCRRSPCHTAMGSMCLAVAPRQN